MSDNNMSLAAFQQHQMVVSRWSFAKAAEKHADNPELLSVLAKGYILCKEGKVDNDKRHVWGLQFNPGNGVSGFARAIVDNKIVFEIKNLDEKIAHKYPYTIGCTCHAERDDAFPTSKTGKQPYCEHIAAMAIMDKAREIMEDEGMPSPQFISNFLGLMGE